MSREASTAWRGLDNVLSLGPRAARVSAVGVARELDLLAGRELKDLLEAATNVEEDLAALIVSATLASSNVAVTTAGNALADGTGPDTNTEEGLADVDDNAHDLAVVLLLESLTDGGHHDLKPQTVDVDAALLLVLVGPLATMLVLGIFPLGADAGLEEMVVGLEGELGDGSEIVLRDARE